MHLCVDNDWRPGLVGECALCLRELREKGPENLGRLDDAVGRRRALAGLLWARARAMKNGKPRR